jgi:hypothetical protein
MVLSMKCDDGQWWKRSTDGYLGKAVAQSRGFPSLGLELGFEVCVCHQHRDL